MAAISRLYVSSDDLHAFIDEMLPPRAATRVSSALEQDDSARMRVAAYLKQKADLRTLYDDVLEEPVPASMMDMVATARHGMARGQR
jgi:anti-sigma factor RsiW